MIHGSMVDMDLYSDEIDKIPYTCVAYYLCFVRFSLYKRGYKMVPVPHPVPHSVPPPTFPHAAIVIMSGAHSKPKGGENLENTDGNEKQSVTVQDVSKQQSYETSDAEKFGYIVIFFMFVICLIVLISDSAFMRNIRIKRRTSEQNKQNRKQ